MKKRSISIIFLTVMIDLIGFGIILPLLPLYGKKYAAADWVVGALVSSYSLMQFVFAPIWGRLSDRIGRRPVLLGSTACACLSYVILAIGSAQADPKLALTLLFVARFFAGICGANITVAQAYIADITPPEKRSSKMGLIGMAFGLGFIIGPVLGGLTSRYLGPTAPGWTAAALCAVNFIWAFMRLGESWEPSAHFTTQKTHWEQWAHTLTAPRLNLLIGIFFLATFCFTCFEVTIGWMIGKHFNIDTNKNLSTVSLLIAYCGVVGACVQSPGTIGKMVKKWGEPKLIALSLFFAAAGIGVLPYVFHWGLLLVGLAVFSIGSSLTRPPVFGMISALAPPGEQGATLGVTQGVGSLARIAGPLFASAAYAVNEQIPYGVCAVLCLTTSLIALLCLAGAARPATAPASIPPA